MRGEDKGESERDEWRSDAWWAALVGRLLHPVQVGIVEAFSCIGLSLCIDDLLEIVDDVEPVHLDYHVGRLRNLGALDFADSRPARMGFMERRYKLTPEGPR